MSNGPFSSCIIHVYDAELTKAWRGSGNPDVVGPILLRRTVLVTCDACGGTGNDADGDGDDCKYCGGSGRYHADRDPDDEHIESDREP